MKKIVFAIIIVMFLACKNNNKSTNIKNDKDTVVTHQISEKDTITNNKTQNYNDTIKDQNHTKLGKEYTSRYICPNHCKGSGSDQPGTCPVCGMELIENPN